MRIKSEELAHALILAIRWQEAYERDELHYRSDSAMIAKWRAVVIMLNANYGATTRDGVMLEIRQALEQ